MQNGERRLVAGPKFQNPHISRTSIVRRWCNEARYFDCITEASTVEVDTIVKSGVKFTVLSPTELTSLASFNYCVVTSLP